MTAARTPDRVPAPTRRSNRRARAAVVLAVLVVAILGLAALPPGGPGPSSIVGPRAPGTSTRSVDPSAWAVHTGRSEPRASGGGSVVGPAPGTTYTVCNRNPPTYWLNNTSGSGYGCYNFTLANGTFCAPSPANATLADLGLNLSVATSPANGIGPAPLNFTWNISVTGGGLPPYRIEIAVFDADLTYTSTNWSGWLDLVSAGIYEVDVFAEDSSCTQTASAAFTVDAYLPALGPNPVHVTATASAPTVPSNVSYAVNVSALPAGDSVLWTTPGFFSTSNASAPGDAWQVYYLPGDYNATACFLTSNGTTLGCGTSPTVVLGGTSAIRTTVSVAPGPYPTNVTFTANVTNPTGLPNDTELYLIAYGPGADAGGTWSTVPFTTTVSVTLNTGCGRPWTSFVPPNGICTVPARYTLIDPSRSLDSGSLGSGLLVANLTANGTPSLWNPTVLYSYGPLNGSLPFNLTVNLSASNGAPPYTYGWSLFGRASGAANASQYPTLNATVAAWSGAPLPLNFTFNRTGVYYLAIFVYDLDDAWVGFALPLIILGNISAAAPLSVTGSGGTGGGGGAPEADVDLAFVATTTGGVGPFGVQWAFGDGTYGSSIPGVPVFHAYGSAGTYTPRVTVRDGSGAVVSRTLASVTVVANPSYTPRAPGVTPAPLLLLGPVLWAAAVGVALFVLGRLAAREEVRRQGEALAAAVEDGADTGQATPPSRE